ncbi:CMP-sialic acid transporter 3 isoform X2 [Panicum miliaceum]|uniref:CMP-sialic acid transporter 3 isoform X2 n=1 Tax=Panicum miliaceum TaxID=4540 RepID=A0A3L6SLS5_PANMI|nr:CMP-sialic acid transporter 3 isoform X2 [Panicum miliaceum]
MNGEVECSVCHAKVPVPAAVSKAYDSHRSTVSSRQRALNVLLVSGDCVLAGLQPILVYMSKVDGKFKFSPISVNFLTEITKIIFAIIMLFIQARHLKVGDKPLLTVSTFMQAARNNVLLAVPAFLYAINNYLKFIMQLYFNPASVKMLSNLKVLWEALALLLIGISVNQLKSLPEGSSALGLPVAAGAYLYTLFFVTVPALASVYNEKALKSQFDTSIYLQNLFLYGYGAIFNFLGLVITAIIQGPGSFNILEGHSKATMFLICNNAAQGILSSFFFKYADTILKKYSSTIATIFTGVASAVLFGHTLTINFVLGISIVIISMHQYLSNQIKDEVPSSKVEMTQVHDHRVTESVCVNVTDSVASELMVFLPIMKAKHRHGSDERQPLLPAHRLLDQSSRHLTYISGFLTYVSEATLLPCCWPSKNMLHGRMTSFLERVTDE